MKLVKIDLKIESQVYLDNGVFYIKEQAVSHNSRISVYATYGNVSCFLGTIEDERDLLELAGPENLIEVLNDRLNEYQWDVIYDALAENNFMYCMNYKIYTAKINN